MTDGTETQTAAGPARSGPPAAAPAGPELAWAVAVLVVACAAAVAWVRTRRPAPLPPPPPAPADPGPPADDSHVLFQLLFESHPAPAWAFDEDTLRFVAVNDAVLRRFGYARERFLQLTVHDVCPEEDAAHLTGEPCGPLTWRHRIASGALVPVEVSTRRLAAGTRLLRLVVASDATDRRKAEDELRERDDLLQNVLTNVPCAVFWKDRASIYIGCNDQAARDHGLTVPGEVIGQTDYDLARVPEEAEGVRAADRAVIDAAEPLLDVEEARTLADGTRAAFLTSRVPLRDPDGKVIGVLGVSQNVTARKRLEEELRHAQKMEAVGRLAGGVAHDFNNLLTIVTGSVHLIRGLPPGDPKVHTYVDEIQAAIDRATGLTRQLLAFSRKQPARPEVLNLNQVVADLSGLLERLIGSGVEVRTELADEPVCVRADRGHLEQVLMNLAVNARDAMPEGGTLRIATACDERFARLTVADTGCGMDEGVKARIFEPFFTTKELGKGTGLGLATVHGIVEQAGGGIEVDTAPGAGAAFHIRLPACSEPTPLPVLTPAPLGPTRTDRTVLLVEDEERVRKTVRATLEGWGYAVVEADRAETALALLAARREVDLLITDLVMPGMDGRELAARVRADRPEIGVVFISGFVPELRKAEGFGDGVFLPKPFTPFDLIRCAERAVRQRHAEAARGSPRAPALRGADR